jgi:hypothetical protein
MQLLQGHRLFLGCSWLYSDHPEQVLIA